MNFRSNKNNYPFYMGIPALLFFIIFYVLSITSSFYYSFTNWNILSLTNIKFTWFENFTQLFSDDNFIIAFKNVFIYTLIVTILKTFLGLLLALILNMKFKSRDFFRALFYFPCILSSLIVGYIFSFIYRYNDGILNQFLGKVGLNFLKIDWLGNTKLALYSITAIDIWMWTGFCAAIFLAGLQSVPSEMCEAAKIDGANRFHIFTNITIPFIIPTINIVLILNIIGGFKVFDLIMATTSGGPGNATESIGTLMYKAQGMGSFGYASAIGFVQFILITIIIVPINYYIRKKEISQ